eukprot:gene1728-497_t
MSGLKLTKNENKGKTILVQFENCICNFDETIVYFYNKEKKPKKLKDTKHFRNKWIKDNFPEKDKEYIEELMGKDNFWNHVEPLPDVIKSLNEILGLGYEVKILLTKVSPNRLNMLNLKMLWIEKHFKFHSWMDKIIFSDDFTCLNGICLITTDPYPETTGDTEVTWKKFIFNQAFNSKIEVENRLGDWSNWKIDLKLDDAIFLKDDTVRPFNLHGSSDSSDVDIFYLFDFFPSDLECSNFANGSKEEDRNLLVVKDGVIEKSFKGRPDECNNALFSTYHLHEQRFPCFVKYKIIRLIPTKVISAIRKVIGLCTSSKYREEIRKSLKNDSTVKQRISVLKKINFQELELKMKNYKTIAFQFCITISLIRGTEIYTKKEAIEQFPDLDIFIYKDEEKIVKNLKILNKYKDIFLEEIKDVEFEQEEDVISVHCQLKKKMNSFENQCNGMLIDMNKESVISYGLDHLLDLNSSWIDKNEKYYFPEIKSDCFVSVYKRSDKIQFYCQNKEKMEKIDKLKEKFDFSKFNFDEFFYSIDFDEETIKITSKRSKLTNKLIEKFDEYIPSKSKNNNK